MFNTFHDIHPHNIFTSFSIHSLHICNNEIIIVVCICLSGNFISWTYNQKWVRDNFLSSLPSQEEKKKYSVILYSKDTQSRGAWCFHQIFTYSSRQSFCKLCLLLLYSTVVVVLSMIFAISTLFLLFYILSFRCCRK